jgi:hypothetical protein
MSDDVIESQKTPGSPSTCPLNFCLECESYADCRNAIPKAEIDLVETAKQIHEREKMLYQSAKDNH